LLSPILRKPFLAVARSFRTSIQSNTNALNADYKALVGLRKGTEVTGLMRTAPFFALYPKLVSAGYGKAIGQTGGYQVK
jgi:hypothetical protein